MNRFLKVVDRFSNFFVSAYITPGGTTFLLLHAGKSEDAIRAFFIEVNEAYAKYLMNPFSDPDAVISSPQFDLQAKTCLKRYVGV